MKAFKLPFTFLPALRPIAKAPLAKSVAIAALVLGSLAALHLAGEPPLSGCAAQRAASLKPVPGFVSLAGMGDPACG